MPAADTRQEFAPPHTPGMLRALVLALIAHAALVAVLAVGVAWRRELPPATFEAELWSAIPQEAAPPPPPEEPEPEPETTAPPEVKPPPPPVEKQAVPDTPSKADIALAKEKERLIEEQKAKELQAKQELERKAREKRQQEQAAKEKLEKDRAAQARLKEQQEKEKALKDKTAREAKEKADKVKVADAAKQKAERAAKEEAKRSEELRQQQLNRLTGLAGASGSGSANSTGTAAKSSGPGANYSGRIQAVVKPNITFTDTIVGNPKTEIEVSLSASGEILSKRIIKRSGNKAWDDAAENAIDKTRKLPLDDGKVWSPMIIVISPQTLVGP